MKAITLNWNLYGDIEKVGIERYCHNCGKKVVFIKTQLKRRNANGKNIYEFDIYKCPDGHTWNRLVKQSKAGTEAFPDNDLYKNSENMFGENQCIKVADYHKLNYDRIDIKLHKVVGRFRLDKVLADHIADLSRTTIQQMIEKEHIFLDNNPVQPGKILKSYQKIGILLFAMREVQR